MTVTTLITRRIAKPWGRRHLSPFFEDVPEDDEKIGEIWFESPDGRDPELLIKYLFTSERLSVQVHPDDDAARAAGYSRGKDEAWLVLAAEPHGTVGLGTVRPLSPEELRDAAVDGSIEQLIDWKPVKAGDFIYSPAGTVHAIGAGVTIIEIQQNVDLTYRLYDYGRPRELHLEEGVAASNAHPFFVSDERHDLSRGRTLLSAGGKFVVERWRTGARLHLRPPRGRPVWITVIDGRAGTAKSGETLLVEGDTDLEAVPGSDLLVAYPGSEVATILEF